ncbi:hypothetical protein L9G15_02515 [Shewanella sp. A3A]|nr:hypothetical protein [Shewanella ferrihydritica]
MASNNTYQPPKQRQQWRNDIPDGELYCLYITDDDQVWLTAGRFAHAAGASSVHVSEFLAGQLNAQVIKCMGQTVFAEVVAYLQQHHTKASSNNG